METCHIKKGSQVQETTYSLRGNTQNRVRRQRSCYQELRVGAWRESARRVQAPLWKEECTGTRVGCPALGLCGIPLNYTLSNNHVRIVWNSWNLKERGVQAKSWGTAQSINTDHKGLSSKARYGSKHTHNPSSEKDPRAQGQPAEPHQ